MAAPSSVNAHPHTSGDEVAVVHNGIIENYESLRERLQTQGYDFRTQTDTEVIAHLVHAHWHGAAGGDLLRAMQLAVAEFHGAYSIAAISTREPGRVVGARAGSPLVVGVGRDDHFLASDAMALASVTRRVAYLEEGDVADVRRESYAIYDAQGQRVDRAIVDVPAGGAAVELGPYRHFMQKEIFEQPRAVADTLEAVGGIDPALFGARAAEVLPRVNSVLILACGTSYYSSLVAKQWIENAGADTVHGGNRQRVSLPRQRAAAGRAGRRRVSVRRNRRHARRAEAREGARPCAYARDLQRGDELDGAPDRIAVPDARGARDRRRVDQGVHDAARRAIPAGAHTCEIARKAVCDRTRRSGWPRCATCQAPSRARWRWSRT